MCSNVLLFVVENAEPQLIPVAARRLVRCLHEGVYMIMLQKCTSSISFEARLLRDYRISVHV